MVDLDDDEIRKRVRSYLEILPKAVGANNHMGSRATQDERVMSAVLDELKAAGLFFVDSRTIATSVAYQLAREKLIPTAKRDMFLVCFSWTAGRLPLRWLTMSHGEKRYVFGCSRI